MGKVYNLSRININTAISSIYMATFRCEPNKQSFVCPASSLCLICSSLWVSDVLIYVTSFSQSVVLFSLYCYLFCCKSNFFSLFWRSSKITSSREMPPVNSPNKSTGICCRVCNKVIPLYFLFETIYFYLIINVFKSGFQKLYQQSETWSKCAFNQHQL